MIKVCYKDKSSNLNISQGTSQIERGEQAKLLQPETLSIDERSLADFLVFLNDYARQVIYYDQEGSKRDWTSFFEKNLIVQIATISKLDLSLLQKQFKNRIDALSSNASFVNLELLFSELIDLVNQIEFWLNAFRNDKSIVGRTLRNLVASNFSASLKQIIACSNALSEYQPPINFFSLQQNWNLSFIDLTTVDKQVSSVKGDQSKQYELVGRKLSRQFETFFKGIHQLKNTANSNLKSIIEGSQEHPPHLTLFIAFWWLFEEVQADLNRLTKEHLDFFYRKVLRLKEKDAVPDQAHLVLELAKKIPPPFKVNKDTLVKATKDANGVEQLFGLDNEIIVDQAKIASLRTLYLHKFFPTSQKESILGLYIAPFANSADGQGGGFTNQEIPSWPTLGSLYSKTPDLNSTPTLNSGNTNFLFHPTARLGFVIASKELLLREGKREIMVEMEVKDKLTTGSVMSQTSPSLDALSGIDLGSEFKVYLSGEKGWISEGFTTDFTLDAPNKKIEIVIKADESVPAITFYDPEVLEFDALNTNLPVLRIDYVSPTYSLNSITQIPNVVLYNSLRNLIIENIVIKTQVCNLKTLIVQNDNGAQDVNAAFQPFGALPRKGSNFFIGSDEVFYKEWDKARLKIEWEKDPELIESIYRYYVEKSELPKKDHYCAALYVLNQGEWKASESLLTLFPGFPDFNSNGNDNIIEVEKSPCEFKKCCKSISFQYITIDKPVSVNSKNTLINQGIAPLSTTTKDGFINLKINTTAQDPFLLDEYPKAIARQTQAVGAMGDKTIDNALYHDPTNVNTILKGDNSAVKVSWIPELPEPPYIPTIKSLTVDYESSSSTSSQVSLFHLYPFEGTFEKVDLSAKPTILPDFKEDNTIKEPAEGTLFIGLESLRPGGKLHLYFQLVESTANPDLEKAEIDWWYLKSNQWALLRPDLDVLSDTTNGLVKPGIVEFDIPWDIDKKNTILSSEYHWIKVSTRKRTAAIAETLQVFTQGVKATFKPDNGNDLKRLSAVLPAKSIAKPLNNIAEIKSFLQPYASFGGRAEESSSHFYTRVSEHLRHKGRALTIFDYERLVLEAFPKVFKVKCLNHTIGNGGLSLSCDHVLAPGFVTIVVVPDLTNLTADDLLAPKVPLETLKEIEAFLKKKSSPFARIRVLNPVYEGVNTDFEVKFVKEKSEDFYIDQIKKDIQRLLTPWANEEGDRIDFGGRIFKSNIIRFVEELDYVEYLRNFKMYSGPVRTNPEYVDEIVGKSIRTILNAGQTKVTAIQEECCQAGSNTSTASSGASGGG